MSECYLNATPNAWDCHDPQCDDSTWDHECPTGPCTLPEHGNAPEPIKPTTEDGARCKNS